MTDLPFAAAVYRISVSSSVIRHLLLCIVLSHTFLSTAIAIFHAVNVSELTFPRVTEIRPELACRRDYYHD